MHGKCIYTGNEQCTSQFCLKKHQKKQLLAALTIGLLGLACILVDGQYKPATVYFVQNKRSMSSSKFIKSFLNFAREGCKCVLSLHHMCIYFLWIEEFGPIPGLLA